MNELLIVYELPVHLCFIIILSQQQVLCTIDVNVNELEYLATRLNPFECRHLIAALHYTTYELPNSLAAAERNVDDEVPCLRHLVHWNGSPAEGKGKTHEALAHRLRQINRNDLADWLGKSAFTQLGKDLGRAMAFDGLSKEETEPSEEMGLPLQSPIYDSGARGLTNVLPITLEPYSSYEEEDPWLQIDVVLLAILLGLLGTLLTLICAMIWHRVRQHFRKTKYKRLNEKEIEDEKRRMEKSKKDIKYNTESSGEVTDNVQVDSETETDFG